MGTAPRRRDGAAHKRTSPAVCQAFVEYRCESGRAGGRASADRLGFTSTLRQYGCVCEYGSVPGAEIGRVNVSGMSPSGWVSYFHDARTRLINMASRPCNTDWSASEGFERIGG